jgi:hypothetical protein
VAPIHILSVKKRDRLLVFEPSDSNRPENSSMRSRSHATEKLHSHRCHNYKTMPIFVEAGKDLR